MSHIYDSIFCRNLRIKKHSTLWAVRNHPRPNNDSRTLRHNRNEQKRIKAIKGETERAYRSRGELPPLLLLLLPCSKRRDRARATKIEDGLGPVAAKETLFRKTEPKRKGRGGVGWLRQSDNGLRMDI